jgi:hypothetical protein
MLEMIRTVLIKMLNLDSTFMTHTSKGRPGEAIGGKSFQHYGFRSIPPSGTDLVTLQDGNNNYSVAENYDDPTRYPGMTEGDVLLYTANVNNTNSVILMRQAGDFDISNKTDNTVQNIVLSFDGINIDSNGGTIEISNDLNRIDIDNGNLTIDKTPTIPGTLAPVATQAFVQAVQVFMTATASATTAAQIAAAATIFNGVVTTLFTTQSVRAL